MANFNFYFASSALLLLTLSCRPSMEVPVPGVTLSAETCAQCSLLFKDLLLNITENIKSNSVCFSIHADVVAVRKAETVQACLPTLTQNSGCMMQRNSSFSESECLKNIMKDLSYYEAAIQSYLKHKIRDPEEETKLLTPVLGIIKSLRESISLNRENGENEDNDFSKVFNNDTFSNRQNMCKMMRGFYLRTITINRAMGYISSGDHRK